MASAEERPLLEEQLTVAAKVEREASFKLSAPARVSVVVEGVQDAKKGFTVRVVPRAVLVNGNDPEASSDAAAFPELRVGDPMFKRTFELAAGEIYVRVTNTENMFKSMAVRVKVSIEAPLPADFAERAKSAEAVTNLGELKEILTRLRGLPKPMVYTAIRQTPGPRPSAHRDRWDGVRCPEDCVRGTPTANCTEFECLEFKPRARAVYYRYACSTDAEGANLTCAAVGDLDGDGKPKMFVYGINVRGGTALAAPIPAIGPTGRCAVEATPADAIIDCDPTEW